MAVKEQFRDPPLSDWQISRLIELIDANPHEEELGFIRGVLSETLRVAQEQKYPSASSPRVKETHP